MSLPLVAIPLLIASAAGAAKQQRGSSAKVVDLDHRAWAKLDAAKHQLSVIDDEIDKAGMWRVIQPCLIWFAGMGDNLAIDELVEDMTVRHDMSTFLLDRKLSGTVTGFGQTVTASQVVRNIKTIRRWQEKVWPLTYSIVGPRRKKRGSRSKGSILDDPDYYGARSDFGSGRNVFGIVKRMRLSKDRHREASARARSELRGVVDGYNRLASDSLDKYGDHGGTISGVLRSHFPSEVKDKLRSYLRDADALDDVARAHWQASGRRSYNPPDTEPVYMSHYGPYTVPILIQTLVGKVQGRTAGSRAVPGYEPRPRQLQALEKALRATGSPSRGSRATAKAQPKPGTKKAVQALAKRFESFNVEDVPDDLLLAVVLAGDIPGDPVLLARTMLGSVGGKLKVLTRNPTLLGAVPGARFAAVSELRRRVSTRKETQTLKSAYDAVDVLRPHMGGDAEKLAAIFLDRRQNVIAVRTLTKGNDAHTIVDPKQVLRMALQLGASGAILGHNHPSGDPTPSSADVDVTARCSKAFEIVGIELLDHVVMIEDGVRWTSLREQGLMPPRAGSNIGFV